MSRTSRFTASIAGVGVSRFGRHSGTRFEDLAFTAIEEALNTSGIDPEQIDTVYVGNVFGPSGVAARVARAAGLCNAPAIKVEAACASGTVAAHLAANDVASGRSQYSMAIGIELISDIFQGAIVPEQSDREGALELPMPGLYALQAKRYMHETGCNTEDLAHVAVKNRGNGALNPIAHRQTPVTIEEVMGSRLIAEPLTLLQCCPMSDGAAAVVFANAEDIGKGTGVGIRASHVAGGRGWPDPSKDAPWGFECVVRATSGLSRVLGAPLTVDLYEVHDAFTIGEILTIEALGLVPAGRAPEALRAGRFHRDGDIPVNPSGGLLARGHALGATGIAQIAECVAQLRGEAGDRQVLGARKAVVETLGGGASGLDGNCAALIALESS